METLKFDEKLISLNTIDMPIVFICEAWNRICESSSGLHYLSSKRLVRIYSNKDYLEAIKILSNRTCEGFMMELEEMI